MKAEINTSYDEIIQFLESDFINKDKNIDAFVHYKCMKAVQYENKSMIAIGEDKDNNIGKSREIFDFRRGNAYHYKINTDSPTF